MFSIDPATGWFEIAQVLDNDKLSAKIAQLFSQVWLCQYPQPKRVRFDDGSEFKKYFLPIKRFCS